ncbi:GNAT family N-acetyltransferase [Pseudomonas sp. F1_0610]|uniref:GNAT family N-acetyltransferase n=1 Tax=Pseudomonas sp. F1_0610 TaxID=3114284 RepID=UPI0039C3DF7B
MIKIRYACVDDIKHIEYLYHQLFCHGAALQPFYLQEAQQDVSFIKETILAPNSDILLAVQASNIIGFAVLQLQKTLPYKCLVPHQYVYLIDFIIDQNVRNQGIGQTLFESVLDWGKQRGAEYLELSTQAENTKAQGFYERNNMAVATLTYRYRF